MRNWFVLFGTSLIVLVASLLMAPRSAQAQVSVCNRGLANAHVAVAYLGKPSDGWIGHGWWRVPIGSCITLLSGRPTPHPYYMFIMGIRQLVPERRTFAW